MVSGVNYDRPVLTTRINNALMADWSEMDHAWYGEPHLGKERNFVPLPMPNGSPAGRRPVGSPVRSQSLRA